MEKEIETCELCGSLYYFTNYNRTSLELCPNCSYLVTKENLCVHDIHEERCRKCYWDGSKSKYTVELVKIRDTLIKEAYYFFSSYPRPQHFTNYKHCDECLDHDQKMLRVTLHTLQSSDFENECWCPLFFLTDEGLAHYMPRLIELYITFDDPIDLVSTLFVHNKYNKKKFEKYTKEQCGVIVDALEYVDKVDNKLPGYKSSEDILVAIKQWKSIYHI